MFVVGSSVSAFSDRAAEYYRYKDDMNIDNWAYDSVQNVRKARIMQGFKDDTFRPKQKVTRAEALIILFKLNKVDESEVNVSVLDKFSDIDRTKWYAKPFAKAIQEHWIEGYQDETVRPHAPVTRAEWAALVQKIYQLEKNSRKLPNFLDVTESKWYYNPVASLYRFDLLFNGNNYEFLPKSFLNRQEIAWQTSAILKNQDKISKRRNANEAYTKNKIKRDYSVWVKDKNFVDLQGTEVQKTGLTVDMVSPKSSVVFTSKDKHYTRIGTLRLANPFNTKVSLSTLKFKAFVPNTTVGPIYHMDLKTDLLGDIIEKRFDRSGQVILSQLKKVIPAKQTIEIPLFIRAVEGASFLLNTGDIIISVGDINTSYEVRYEGENKEQRGKLLRKATPLEMKSISLAGVKFQP